MRFIVLAAATLFLTGNAMAAQHHHSHHAANVAVPEGAAPADVMSPHDARIKNLHDSGYNPSSDFDAFGNVRQN